MIQNHLTSQSLSKRLKELRVPQKSEYYWEDDAGDIFLITKNQAVVEEGEKIEDFYVSAFLSSELGELLPQFILKDGYSLELHIIRSSVWRLYYGNPSEDYSIKFTANTGDSLAESVGLMLEYLILNGLIKL